MNITTEYSTWFIPLCLLLGVAYGAVLYYRNKNDELPDKLKRGLFVLRALSVAIIAFLLLGPMIKYKKFSDIKPVVVLATDASLSMETSLNEQEQTALQTQTQYLIDRLSNKYNVQPYIFGSETYNKPCDSFYMQSSNLGDFFENIDIQYKNANLGAVVLISDGMNNEGKEPLYAALPIEASIYTVGVGDTTKKTDLALSKVSFNKQAYKGNLFPVQILIQGQMAAGAKSKVTIKHGEKIIDEKKIDISSNRFSTTSIFHLHADSVGFYRYSIDIKPIANEQNISNNHQEIIVEVLDRKQKALILVDAPHPDAGMLKEILEKASFEVESVVANRFKAAQVNDYDVVILHSLPSLRNSIDDVLQKCNEHRIPLLFILGNNINLVKFNSLQTGLAITQQKALKQEVLLSPNRSFSSFSIDNAILEDSKQWPPLIAPFGGYLTAYSLSPLFYQKIGTIETLSPLMAFNSTLSGKYAFICGEGIWRWRMNTTQRTGSSRYVDELISKSVQLLISDDKTKRFKVYFEKEYAAYDRIIFRAELYNQAYEPITNEEVTLSVRNEYQDEYQYVFGIEGNNYKLDVGSFLPGIYQWTAQTKIGTESFTEKGAFSITTSSLELEQNTANYHLLMDLSAQHNGHFYTLSEMEKIADVLHERSDLKPVRITAIDYFSLINLAWLVFVILAMLFAEWFLRKYFGSY